MAYIDVCSWSAEHVVGWLRGLHSSLKPLPLEQIVRSRVNGNRLLLLLSAQDLTDLIPGLRVEALEAILMGVNLLRYLNYNSNRDTLQSLTLNLACQARYLHNQLIQAELSPRILPVSTTLATPMTGTSKNRFDFAKVDSNMQINQSTKQRVSLESLEGVSTIVDQIIDIVNWLNNAGLSSQLSKFNKDFKSIVLRVAVELTSTAQRDQFVEHPNDILKKTSKFLADYCDWVVLEIADPDFIQPCWLDAVSVKKKPEEQDFGIVIQQTISGFLTVEEVVFSSPAHRSGRMSIGDDIIQIDYQTIVGWPLDKVKDLIRSYKSEIILTLRKKPSQSALNPSVVVMRPYAIPLKRVLSYNSESVHTVQDEDLHNQSGATAEQALVFSDDQENLEDDNGVILEPPKEPKGPVYELQSMKSRHELKRRVSISGSISDALVDLSLADSLPIPSLVKAPSTSKEKPEKFKLGRITRETLTKSISHDTAKLYLHTLSIDRKHLWLPQSSKDS